MGQRHLLNKDNYDQDFLQKNHNSFINNLSVLNHELGVPLIFMR